MGRFGLSPRITLMRPGAAIVGPNVLKRQLDDCILCGHRCLLRDRRRRLWNGHRPNPSSIVPMRASGRGRWPPRC